MCSKLAVINAVYFNNIICVYTHATADGLPSFRIGTSELRNGANSIALTVSHSECGRANLNLNVQFRRSTNPPPGKTQDYCKISFASYVSMYKTTITII